MSVHADIDLAPISAALIIAQELCKRYHAIYGERPPMPANCTEYHDDPGGIVCEPSRDLLDLIHWLDSRVF